ncbi:single-stranded-DNA-specific exonuclease RecJ [Rhodanobacter sp. DHG33]|uniref:single-stranded-DNA-specific exonuclease RecJ n=1 Tax=Rhodanobacter sp. DHG33 TaxID=2775921 RepID=UPI001785C03E|nr:single-stranded-DNA-specific exonuclease RecJ [Rhodanobacter sp. DHG33]MBD8898400.1 single-stranded-DNA-specific exonuclease RecJ [Rhodanobacter sp. DHG33]
MAAAASLALLARGAALNVLELRRREPQGEPSGWDAAVHPVLQRIYAARGVLRPDGVEHRLQHLLQPQALGGLDAATELLAEAIRGDWAILIAGDYDCDGATGTAVAVRGLRMLGARRVGYAVPNRFVHGYGLTPALVDSLQPRPQLIVTVDNGVASVAGVARARELGMRVIVTDHHLPGEQLPDCDAMVNPNLVGDGFPSKALAGVGVMFYLLLALRAKLYPSDRPDRDDQEAAIHGRIPQKSRPDLSTLLDLVALGTVADLVPLDFNNRVLVEAGLRRIRSGRACVGIAALIECGKRSAATLCASDLGFAVGPRLNAAGRLEDMQLGVECLLTDDAVQARRYAGELDAINRERRDLQASMVAEAEVMTAGLRDIDAVGVALYEPSWHAGVVGLVASKLKERLHRPVIAFAPASEDDAEHLRGSGRSIPGFHLRDALATIDARQPGLIERFGGHAMAAGLSLRTADFPRFAAAFDAVARELIAPERLQAALYTDGELPAGNLSLELALQLRSAGPWGQAFPEPLFDNVFECANWKPMGEGHWRLGLRDPRDGSMHDAVMFNVGAASPPSRLRAVYELVVNDWQGRESPRLLLRHVEPA